MERRQLLDTYKTFGCESGEPTFRYSLIDGVNDGFLINPIVTDARTEITTQLLSDKGYSIQIEDPDGGGLKVRSLLIAFEQNSKKTNGFCETFMNMPRIYMVKLERHIFVLVKMHL